MTTLPKQTLITVCDRCKTASCWAGEFMCQESKNAGIEEMTVAELQLLNREHPDHWEKQVKLANPKPETKK